MEKATKEDSRVQQDRFWIWRINREENQVVREISNTQEKFDNQKKLQTSIDKAKTVASKIKNRASIKSSDRSPN